MISEMCSISTSPEDVTVPDRMVKIEMEAAEALANLSQPINTSHFGGKIAGKAKRGKRQVKCDSPPTPADSAPSCSDLALDPAVLLQQQDERNLPNIAKAEPDDQLINQSHICADYLSLGGGKSSQNLSEAEKEAKRLRRVLANRESARRTIRRRQALCEELARKAAQLTKENEKLKKGKESALREYELLELRNKNLKAKVEKVAKPEGEKTPNIKKAKAAKPDIVEHINVLKPSQTEMLTNSLANNLPVLLHNPPVTPFMWPALFQSSNAGPSIIHVSHTVQASCNPGPCKEQSTANIGPPVYILPFPLFMDQVHHCQTSCCSETRMEHELLEMSNQRHQLGCSSSRTIAPDEGEADVMRVGKACGEVRFDNDLNEIPVASPPLDEDDHMADAGSELHLSVVSGKEEEDVVVSEQEKKHQGGGSFLTLSGKKKLVVGTAAAEARRRRKELKKLKAVHGGQCRMRC